MLICDEKANSFIQTPILGLAMLIKGSFKVGQLLAVDGGRCAEVVRLY